MSSEGPVLPRGSCGHIRSSDPTKVGIRILVLITSSQSVFLANKSLRLDRSVIFYMIVSISKTYINISSIILALLIGNSSIIYQMCK